MLKTTILLADAQYLVRTGLRCILAQHNDFQVIEEVADHAALQPALKRHRPNLMIIDYNAPGHFTVESIVESLESFPDLKVLVISDDNNKNSIFRILECGVHSFLTKTCDAKEIADAVMATARGDKFFCTKVLDALLEKSLGKLGTCAPSPLSAREVEIIQLIAKGYVAKEIAGRLHLSTHTVYTHRKNIMKKLQLQTPSELMLYALNNGILETN